MSQYKSIAEGQIPEGLELKTSCLKGIIEFAKKYRAAIAVIIASARRDDFANNVVAWIEWANDNELAGSDLHHLRQIGDLLLDAKSIGEELYSRLFAVDTEKLKAIQRLPRNDLTKFLEAYPPEKLNRDQIRDAVNKCLGETPAASSPKSSKYQPSLWESLDVLLEKDEQDFQAMAMDEKFNENSARKFAIGSLGMMTACTTYWRSHGGGDAEIMAAVEKQLRDEADALAELRNSMAASLKAG